MIVTLAQGLEELPDPVLILPHPVVELRVLEGLLRQRNVMINAVKELTEGGVLGLWGNAAVISIRGQVQ